MKAVLLGATGATGRAVLKQLIESPKFREVVCLGRRRPEADSPKVTCVVMNLDDMAQASEHFSGADVVFCTLGTTRKVAGSAEAFKKVDHEYVAESARIARAQGVKHYSLVTAMGANPHVWACDAALFHGLLYMRTKGRAEVAVLRAGFPRVSIFRPGALDRGDLLRPNERMALKLMRTHKMHDLAGSIVLDAVRSDAPPVSVFSAASLFQAAGTPAPPVPSDTRAWE